MYIIIFFLICTVYTYSAETALLQFVTEKSVSNASNAEEPAAKKIIELTQAEIDEIPHLSLNDQKYSTQALAVQQESQASNVSISPQEIAYLCEGFDADAEDDEYFTQPFSSGRESQTTILYSTPEELAYLAEALASVDDEDKDEITETTVQTQQLDIVPRELKPRFAQLIFNGYDSIEAISSAINAETKCLDLSFYELSAKITQGLSENYNPILCALYNKKDTTKNILLDRGILQKNPDLGSLFLVCECNLKESSQQLTMHAAAFDHSLHQKIYLFETAYQGDPVCFISTQNPTDHSISKQYNTTLMISGVELYTELKKRFDLLFTTYANPIKSRTHASKAEHSNPAYTLESFEFEATRTNALLPKLISTIQSIKLEPEVTTRLLATPLKESPGNDIVDEITTIIDREKTKLYFIHRSLTDAKVVHALIRAIRRDAAVHVIIDKASLKNNKDHSAYLALTRLHQAIKDKPHCSLGVITNAKSPMMHDKTLACENEGNGLIATGSWNSTGNSTRNACEVTTVCTGNSALYEQIKKKFIELKNGVDYLDQPFYQSSKDIMSYLESAQPSKVSSPTDISLTKTNSYIINNCHLYEHN